MSYEAQPIEPTSVIDRATDTLIGLVARIIVPVIALVLFAACETPTSVSPDGSATAYSATSARMNEAESDDVFLIDEDGSARAITSDDQSVVVTNPAENRVALHVVGMARYDHATVKRLELNVRQTAAGEVDGVGRVTLGEHTTNVVPLCVTPYYSFGRMQYGVGVELAEPWIMPTPYGTIVRTHVSISVTEDGEYTGLQGSRFGPVCGASASLYPTAVASGNLQVIETAPEIQ